MLDIKKVIPKEEYEAVYVTEENVKAFIDYAYHDEFDLDTIEINRSESPYIYAVVKCKDSDYWVDDFLLNLWYIKCTNDSSEHGWFDEEYFLEKYKIVGDCNG